MTRPFVGAPTIASGGCAFGAALDGQICGQPCTTHLAVQAQGWGLVALSTCDAHVAVARATGQMLAEHPHRPECESTDCWEGVV